jgi:hypothetical protein
MAAMHSVQRAKHPDGGCTLNVLPCRINHNGPVNASERYWNPVVDSGRAYSARTVTSQADDLFRGDTHESFARQETVGKTCQGA